MAEGLPELIACEDEANISDLESNCELFAAEHENPNAPDSALAETAYEVDGRSGLTACEYEANISDLGSNYNFVAAEHKHPSVLEKPLAETNYEADGLSGLIAREHEANISELGSNCQFLAAEHELSNAPVRQLAEASYGVELPGLIEKPFAGPGGNPSSSGCNESAVNPYDALYEALWTRERMSVAEAMAFTGLNEHGLEGGTLVGLWSYLKGDTWVQRA